MEQWAEQFSTNDIHQYDDDSRNTKGAKKAVIVMIFVALIIEELIIAEAWFASSLIPDPENGRYILIFEIWHPSLSARHIELLKRFYDLQGTKEYRKELDRFKADRAKWLLYQ